MKAKRGGYEGPEGWVFELTGGALCFDFVNTVDNRPTEKVAVTGRKLGDTTGEANRHRLTGDELDRGRTILLWGIPWQL
jgi:hypothetical protein